MRAQQKEAVGTTRTAYKEKSKDTVEKLGNEVVKNRTEDNTEQK